MNRQRQTDMLRQDYSYGKYIYKNKTHMTTRYDLIVLVMVKCKVSISAVCKNFFNLLLKYLTEENSFKDEGN